MASAINETDINENFPTAGVDNDSQGFRTNFTSIKNNLSTAKSEITDLQANTAKTNADNDFAENKIKKAILQDVSEEVQVLLKSNLESTVEVDYEIAPVHKITISAAVTNLRFSNWPDAGTYGRIIVHLLKNVDGGSDLIVRPSTDVGGVFKVSSNWGAYNSVRVTSSTEPTILELYSYDAGNTVYMDLLSYTNMPESLDPLAT